MHWSKGETLSHISAIVTKFNIVKSFVSGHNPADVGLTEPCKQPSMCFLVCWLFFSLLLVLNCTYLIDDS